MSILETFRRNVFTEKLGLKPRRSTTALYLAIA